MKVYLLTGEWYTPSDGKDFEVSVFKTREEALNVANDNVTNWLEAHPEDIYKHYSSDCEHFNLHDPWDLWERYYSQELMEVEL